MLSFDRLLEDIEYYLVDSMLMCRMAVLFVCVSCSFFLLQECVVCVFVQKNR